MDRTNIARILFYIISWALLSVAAAYPAIVLRLDPELLTNTRDGYVSKDFIFPAFLFMCIFMLDLCTLMQGIEITCSRGKYLKGTIVCILLFFIFFTLHFVFSPLLVKILTFALMWLSITAIKGISLLIVANEKEPLEGNIPN